MSNAISYYDQAKSALAQCYKVDEVKDIRDKAVAMQVYAQQAKDRELIDYATEIRLRAERRAGELLKKIEKSKGGGEPGVGRRGKNAVTNSNRISPSKLSDLGVTKRQSSKWQKLADLGEAQFEQRVQDMKDQAKSGKKGRGRPKGSKNKRPPEVKQAQRSVNTKPEVWEEFKKKAEGEGTTAAAKLGELVQKQVEEPEIDPAIFSLTVKQKFDLAVRQHQRKLDAEFEQRVRDECRKRLDDWLLPDYYKQLKDAEDVLNARRGIMTSIVYKKIISCLHPDSRQSVTEKKLQEAFNAFKELEIVLCKESEVPTPKIMFPRTHAEAEALKQKVKEARRAKRAGRFVASEVL